MSSDDLPAPLVARYDGLLGTVVEVRVHARDAELAGRVERAVAAEIVRLESVFSVYDPASQLVRWRAGDPDAAGAELHQVLGLALAWHERSGGAFAPSTGTLTARWRRAAAEGVEPRPHELDALASAAVPYRVVDGRAALIGDGSSIDLNALAKGWIVDAAAACAAEVDGVEAIVVNAGGDLVHRGRGSVRVGVENPRRPFDNEPPLAVVALADGALATTGGARRGLVVGAARHSHVLDPRTGRPVAHTRSATVLAADAATADVVATVAGVLTPDEAIAFVDGLDGVACLLVPAEGDVRTSVRWPAVRA